MFIVWRDGSSIASGVTEEAVLAKLGTVLTNSRYRERGYTSIELTMTKGARQTLIRQWTVSLDK